MFVVEAARIQANAARAAGWLAARGARPGDRVALVASNRPEYLALTLGALRTGVVPVLVNVHLAPSDRDWILADADPAVTATDDQWPAFDAAPAALAPLPLSRAMHYTSGTTGRPKGVWTGVFDEATARAHFDDEASLWGEQRHVVVCSPLYHSAPHRIAVSTLLRGGRVTVFERFDAPAVAAALREATGAFLVPTHLRRLAAVEGFAMPRATRVCVAGEPCPEPVMRDAMRAIRPLWQFYGSTEGQFTAISPDDWAARPASVGRPRTGRSLRVTDPGPDGAGTVWVTAPPFARWEYWRDAERTAQAWDGDWFTVGDLGRLDAAGFLYLEGRREDLVISGGVNVYPAEVERVLLAHPAVVECAVYGEPDDEFGQRVCAAVVADGVSAEDVVAWARERLPGSHRPKRVVFVDALPRTATGKVRRTELRTM